MNMLLRAFWIAVILAAGIILYKARELGALEDSFRRMQLDALSSIGDRMAWETPKLVLTALAATAVFFVFLQRFDGWPTGAEVPKGFPGHTPRYFTTRLRFRAWAFLYGAVVCGVFLILVFAPTLVDGAVSLLLPVMPSSKILSNIDKILSTQSTTNGVPWSLGAAVMIIGIFYKSDWERSMRQLFQNNALIPRQAEQIFDTLRHKLAASPIEPKSERHFLRHFRERDELLTYWDFDLNPDSSQQAQGKLELLARTEFLVWRMTHGGLPASVATRVRENRQVLSEIEAKLTRIRAEASSLSDQLSTVVNILVDNLAPENLEPFMARLRTASNLPDLKPPVRRLPVSRLDDVIPILEEELERIADPIKSPGQKHGPVLHIVETHSTSTRAIEKLERQVASLRALVPLCVRGLDTVRSRISALADQLTEVSNATLRFVICIGLAVQHDSSKRFFTQMGLRPRLGRDFNLGLGISMATLPMLAFFLVVLWQSGYFEGPTAAAAAAATDAPLIQPGEKLLWLLFGGFYISWPLIHGCYLGSVITHSHMKLGYAHDEGNLSPFDYLAGFLNIWSVLVLGATALILVFNLSVDKPMIYASALPFAAIPAVWGMLVAAATFRKMQAQPGAPVIKWWELIGAVALVYVFTELAWMQWEEFGVRMNSDLRDFVTRLAPAMTLNIALVIWVGTSPAAEAMWLRIASNWRGAPPEAEQPTNTAPQDETATQSGPEPVRDAGLQPPLPFGRQMS